jgi:hypothetical protein
MTNKGMMTSETPESVILRSCLDLLRLRGIFCWRQNSAGLYTQDRRLIRTADLNGISDIVGLTPSGRFLAVECKSARGRQTESQKQFQAAIERNHGLYIIARDIEDLGPICGAPIEGTR